MVLVHAAHPQSLVPNRRHTRLVQYGFTRLPGATEALRRIPDFRRYCEGHARKRGGRFHIWICGRFVLSVRAAHATEMPEAYFYATKGGSTAAGQDSVAHRFFVRRPLLGVGCVGRPVRRVLATLHVD